MFAPHPHTGNYAHEEEKVASEETGVRVEGPDGQVEGFGLVDVLGAVDHDETLDEEEASEEEDERDVLGKEGEAEGEEEKLESVDEEVLVLLAGVVALDEVELEKQMQERENKVLFLLVEQHCAKPNHVDAHCDVQERLQDRYRG